MAGLVLAGIGVALVALVPGYLLWLGRGRAPSPSGRAAVRPASRTPPRLDLIVPVHDEAPILPAKVADLLALRWPADRLSLWIVDGASRDGSAALARRLLGGRARATVIEHPRACKTAQVNAALARATGDWIVVSDADALLPEDVLERMFGAAHDPAVGAIGVSVEPRCTHPLERLYWRVSNGLRRRESRRGSASIVAGPCYAFRRDLVARLPDDVVADDVHVALAAATAGRRVGFVEGPVVEVRSPAGLPELFAHKRRKADGYLREVFRFLPRARSMSAPARGIFLWRAAQLTAFPVLVAAGAGAAALAAAGLSAGGAFTASHGVVVAACVVPSVGLGWRWAGRRADIPWARCLGLGLLLAAVQLVALLVHPFSRQTACYPKVGRPASASRRAA